MDKIGKNCFVRLVIIKSYLITKCLFWSPFKNLILRIKYPFEQFQDGRGMYSNCTVLVWYFFIFSHFHIMQINEQLNAWNAGYFHGCTDIACKKRFSSILVIIHRIDIYFKKSSSIISITLMWWQRLNNNKIES